MELNMKEKVHKTDILIIANEIKMVQKLACNDPNVVDKQLENIRHYLKIKANKLNIALTEIDFLTIWKGLYTSMWMCDKPLNQENLAENICQILYDFNDVEKSIKFFSAFLTVMSNDENNGWHGLDQWRIDKFLMLIRRMFRHMFRILCQNNWPPNSIDKFNFSIYDIVLKSEKAIGFAMHVTDIYLEELAKVANGCISGKVVSKFIHPFIDYIAKQHEMKLLGYIRNRIFYHLLWQSELGREYSEKFNAWKEMGFPSEHIDDLEKVKDVLIEDKQGVINPEKDHDPRAGSKDIYIPPLPVSAALIMKKLKSVQYSEKTNTKSRSIIKTILEKYRVYSEGEFSLGIKKIRKNNCEPFKILVKQKVESLENLNNELYGTTKKLKKLNKRKRKKLLDISKFDENANEDDLNNVYKVKYNLSGWIEENIKDSSKTLIQSKIKEASKSKIKSFQINQKSWKESNVINSNFFENAICLKNLLQINTSEEQQLEWSKPLNNGEIEYFVPTKKLKIKEANSSLNSNVHSKKETKTNFILNPYANKHNHTRKEANNIIKFSKKNSLQNDINITPNKAYKKIIFALDKNKVQQMQTYQQQIIKTPDIPYDGNKKPEKGILKPFMSPGPINPFYK